MGILQKSLVKKLEINSLVMYMNTSKSSVLKMGGIMINIEKIEKQMKVKQLV
jgi:hypothetical protein